VVSGNSAGVGGGIFNATGATLNAGDSTIAGNTANAAGGGGGIADFNGSALTLTNSTVSGNTAAGQGGGILNQNSTATLINSTISGNTAGAGGDGGGIENHASSGGTTVLTLTNCTISANTAARGSAVLTADLFNNAINAETIISNTLVAGNNGPNFFVAGTQAKLTDQGNNLDSDGSSGFTNGSNGNQAGTSGAPIHALLAPLANYGGATQTHALLPGSPAINRGNPAFVPPPATDQRGFSRVFDGRIDIGSVEVNYAINVTAGTPQTIPINTAFPVQAKATVTESGNAISGVTVTFTAPVSGASGFFTGNATTAIATTDLNGVATAPVFTANGTAGGPYNVVAGLGGNLASANFALTNTTGDQTIAFAAIANKTFGDADFSVSATASSGLAVSLAAVGNCTVSSPSPGVAHITAAGSCTITASQGGNSNYNAATNVAQSFNIAKAPTVVSVTSSVNPSDLTQSVIFTATVASSGSNPTGTVQFKDNGNNLGAPLTLNGSGIAQLPTSALTVGTHTITADYIGDGNFLASTSTLAGGQVVRPQPTLSINDVSVVEGDSGTQTMNFTVTLSAASNLTVSAQFATADGTATAPSDYTATNGTVTFNPGDTTKTIGVTINGDVNFELDETFTVTLSNLVNAGISKGVGLGTIKNDDPLGGVISLSQTNYNVTEATGFITVTITRSKDARNPVTVDYATDDTGAPLNCGTLNSGLATARCDFTAMFGTMQFAANETQKTIDIPINRDGFAEGPEVFKFNLTNPTGGAVLGLTSSSTVTITDSAIPSANAIDDTDLFVRQQYHDFLNREPDASGLAFWTDNIDKCNDPARLPAGQTVAQCIETQRIITSAAFFLSIEFRQTGGLVRDFYVAALNRPATNNMPTFIEFTRDTQAAQRGVTVGQGNWQAQLVTNRVAFMNDFVMRAEFVGLYPTTDTPAQYVDKLYLHANVTPGSAQERADAIAEFAGAGTAADPGARGRALLRITQNAAFQARELNRGFVQMQYFGYLRRNPNDPPDNNFNGYDFWVNKLNQFNGDFLQAEMVKAFLISSEYRGRFGP
jgi:Bacterial Ig-like domain (group 3)/Calx-beta domain